MRLTAPPTDEINEASLNNITIKLSRSNSFVVRSAHCVHIGSALQSSPERLPQLNDKMHLLIQELSSLAQRCPVVRRRRCPRLPQPALEPSVHHSCDPASAFYNPPFP